MANVKVAVRVRPLSESDIDKAAHIIIGTTEEHSLTVHNPKLEGLLDVADSRERVKTFVFDNVYCSLGNRTPDCASQQLVLKYKVLKCSGAPKPQVWQAL
ncbi:hypothetical protein LSAT2_011888 [Lamellibrachia satsuma]|nr:hypothetical protein LSAT2_011888 [Lamellibrachia satsuma]